MKLIAQLYNMSILLNVFRTRRTDAFGVVVMNSVFVFPVFPWQIELWDVFNGLNGLGYSLNALADRQMCCGVTCVDPQILEFLTYGSFTFP